MKKWLTLILLLITLTGTFYPCCLVDGCNDEEVATAQKGNKEQPEGACSPFFACATCAGFTATVKLVQIVQPIIGRQVHHENLVVSYLTTYASSFWQPPRFC